MNNILKSVLIMVCIALIASYALSHVNNITEPRIKKQEMEKQQNALSEVLPGYVIKEEKTINGVSNSFTVWIAEKAENDATEPGYAFIAEKAGYSGNIRSMVGVDKNFKILGISILLQSETPGLGARSTEIASSGTFFGALFGSRTSGYVDQKPWFQEQFEGLNLNQPVEILKKGDWNESIKNELIDNNAVSAITGATITTRAVKESVEENIIVLKKYLNSATETGSVEVEQ